MLQKKYIYIRRNWLGVMSLLTLILLELFYDFQSLVSCHLINLDLNLPLKYLVCILYK